MAVRVQCPVCRAALSVNNPKYLVVVHCHACGCQFLADGKDLPETMEPAPAEAESVRAEDDDIEEFQESWQAELPILTFCRMCGELAAETQAACPACGEPLPDEKPPSNRGWDPSTKQARRFRRQAQILGVLWLFLAYLLVDHDFWVGGSRLPLPEAISGARVMVPPIPLMSTSLVCLAVFALVGQFWAVAVGGLSNYLVLFLMVWQANVLSLVVLGAVIVLTHIALHQATSGRFW